MGIVKGHIGPGDQRGLCSGFLVNWSNASTVLYTSSATCTGFVLLHVLARTPSGTQPLSFTVSVNGSPITSTLSLGPINATMGVMATFGSGFTQAIIGGPNQTISVAPLTPTSGSCYFDALGYEFQ